jgi:hypothetical protein
VIVFTEVEDNRVEHERKDFGHLGDTKTGRTKRVLTSSGKSQESNGRLDCTPASLLASLGGIQCERERRNVRNDKENEWE